MTTPLPDPDEQARIDALAQPARVRRAPRYRAFFLVGVLLGLVLGFVLALVVSDDDMINRWVYFVVTMLGTTLVTTLAAGLLAVLADRRSAR